MLSPIIQAEGPLLATSSQNAAGARQAVNEHPRQRGSMTLLWKYAQERVETITKVSGIPLLCKWPFVLLSISIHLVFN